MIKGLGIDIVSIPDFSSKLANKAFLERTFTSKEFEDCFAYKMFNERFSGKFAAKEAFMKALGKGIRQEVWFLQIEVQNNAAGAPYLLLYDNAAKFLRDLLVDRIHLSISHSHNYAVAVVILESYE